MTTFKVVVENLIKDGHPHQFLTYKEKDADAHYKYLIQTYPYCDIKYYKIEPQLIKEYTAKVKMAPVKCPRGHDGKMNGSNVVIASNHFKDSYFCKVCGEIWEAKT